MWSRLRANRLQNRRRKTICKHGHEISGDNIYVTPRGRRECRLCKARRNGTPLAPEPPDDNLDTRMQAYFTERGWDKL